MSNGSNPFILFLILILLLLSSDPKADQQIETFKNVIDKFAATTKNFKASMNSMSNDFNEVHAMFLSLNKSGGKPD